jgi:hypothetical protein
MKSTKLKRAGTCALDLVIFFPMFVEVSCSDDIGAQPHRTYHVPRDSVKRAVPKADGNLSTHVFAFRSMLLQTSRWRTQKT